MLLTYRQDGETLSFILQGDDTAMLYIGVMCGVAIGAIAGGLSAFMESR